MAGRLRVTPERERAIERTVEVIADLLVEPNARWLAEPIVDALLSLPDPVQDWQGVYENYRDDAEETIAGLRKVEDAAREVVNTRHFGLASSVHTLAIERLRAALEESEEK